MDQLPESNRPSDQNVVNWECALEAVEHDHDLLEAVIEGALEETPELLQQLESALQNGQPVEAQRACHTLKGNAQSLGVELVAAQSAIMEELAASEQFSSLRKELPRLHEIINLMTRELNNWLNER